MAIWLPNKACHCSAEKVQQSGIVEYDDRIYCKMCRGYVEPQVIQELDLTPVAVESTDNDREKHVAQSTAQASSIQSTTSTHPKANGLESAQLASMGYLHSIALVVTAGVVTGFFIAAGLLLSLVFDSAGAAVAFFFVGGIVGIAMLISSITALLRADRDRNRARSQYTTS